MSWDATENGPAKGLSKPHQEPLNLYVHPEPSPELEERLLRDSAGPLQTTPLVTDGTTRSLDSQPSGSLEPRKDFNYEAQPCLASSPSAAQRDPRVFTLSTAGRSSDSYDGQHSSLMGCSDSHSLHLGAGNGALLDQDRTECNMDFRQRLPSDAAAAVMAAPQQQLRILDQQLQQQQQPQQHQHQQPRSSERAWPQQSAGLQHNADGGSGAPLSSFEPMQADYGGGCKSPSTCPTREAAAGAELVSVHSLSLSGPDRDLLDQLLGSEPGASSPPLVTPSSFLATGPFADASLQPAFSDYSQRPTPSQQLADHLDAEADSASRRTKTGAAHQHPQQQQPLVNAYSEPLPFSAPLPHHLALHPPPPCPSSRPAAGGGPASAEGAAAAQYQPPPPPQQGRSNGAGVVEGGAQRWPNGQGDGRGGYEPMESVQQQQEQQQQSQQQQQQQLQQQQQQLQQQQQQLQQQQMTFQRPRSTTHVGTPYGTSSQSMMPSPYDEPGLLPPAHSAPVPGMSLAPRLPSQMLKPGGLTSSGGAASPMHVDPPALNRQQQQGYAPPFPNGGAANGQGTSASAGNAMDIGPGPQQQLQSATAAACANPASSAGGPYPAVPMQSSPSDSRGKRLRPHTAEGRPAAAAAAPTLAPAAGPPPPQSTASAGNGAATAAARASSPSSRSQSAGDPMSVSGMEGAGMYGQGPGYPYPYGMPPPYPMSYGMSYGDPYYHSGYGYHPMMDAPPPPGGPDAMAANYGGPPPHGAQMHYPGYLAPRQRLYRRFVSGPHGRRDGAGQGPDAPPAAGGQGQEGLMTMGSAPVGSSGAAPPHAPMPSASGRQQPAPSAPAAGSMQGYPGSAVRPGGVSCGGGGSGAGAASGAAAIDMQQQQCGGAADQASAGGAAAQGGGGRGHPQAVQMQGAPPRPAPGGPPAGPVDMESSMAARACHEQFASDDVPLPLPRSTVDGIRQELRVVTQEFLQRRMDLARSKQLQAAAAAAAAANSGVDGGPPRLQPSNSWAAGDTLSMSMSSLSAPTAPATAPYSHPYPAQHPHPQHSAMPLSQSVDGFPHGMGGMTMGGYPSSAATGGGSAGGPSGSLPNKRGASAGLSAGGGTVSPVRARPAPSAPTAPMAAHSAPAAGVRGAASGVRRSAGGFACDSVTGAPLQSVASEPVGGMAAAGSGPSAMRQLFPPPGPGAGAPVGGCGGHFGNGGGSYGAPGGGGGVAGKPQQSAPAGGAAPAASAPLGPRPAMSGKSSASATHSVSVAQTAPVRGAVQQQQQHQHQQQLQQHPHHQQQPKGAGVMGPMGSYRVGQQGSMAAEVEDDGEEVHGPPQRSSATRPVGPPAAGSSSAGGPPSMPMPPGYYGGAVAPPPYDYPPGYYYPPPSMPGYGMRMYGMPPPPPSMPPGYRAPPSSGVPMYGMPPPGMPYNGTGAVPPSWPEYGAPPMSGGVPMGPQSGPGAPMTHGPVSGGMSGMAGRGGSAAGGGPPNEYMQTGAGR